MPKEQLKTFLEKVKGETNLQARLKAAKSQDDVVSIAKEHGYEFGAEHISQLSEEELEGVAGGTILAGTVIAVTAATAAAAGTAVIGLEMKKH